MVVAGPMSWRFAALLIHLWASSSRAQTAGKSTKEEHPELALSTCSKTGGCVSEDTVLTMDSQWRWLHDDKSSNCIQGNKWAVDEKDCGSTCALEGITKSAYETTYGVTQVEGGVRLKYVNGASIGSRLYMMDSSKSTYKLFQLLNREFSFDVDVSSLGCGINGALYFVEMHANGSLGVGQNDAGAKLGTGYCDAQCPHDLKFVHGQCNIKGWHMTPTGPVGHYGSCCSEMDIWEANAMATAYTAHPCETVGPLRCEGTAEPNVCGDSPTDCDCCGEPDTCPCCGRFDGVCDKDGCDFNSFRLGNKSFFGHGPQFTLDTSKPMTVVTQFITSDGTDTGDLVEIRRLYVQDGKIINNSVVSNIDGLEADSITDDFCSAQKRAFDNQNDFTMKGGLRAMGESLKRGMVLVLSIWDDELTQMLWLDSLTPKNKPASKPGVQRGPCAVTGGQPEQVRTQSPEAAVTYANMRVGEIGSTYSSGSFAALSPAAPAAGAQLDTSSAAPSATGEQGAADIAAGLESPVCCSSASGVDKCSSCWRASLLTEGYCASETHCASCGGQWCPNGVVFAEEFEVQQLHLRTPSSVASWAALGASGAVALAAVAALLLRTGRWRALTTAEEQARLVEASMDA